MIDYKKLERSKPLVVAATIGTLIAPQAIKLYCKDREEELVCLNNNVDDSLRQTQPTSENIPNWGVVDESIATASGNASVYPSPSPSPPPVS